MRLQASYTLTEVKQLIVDDIQRRMGAVIKPGALEFAVDVDDCEDGEPFVTADLPETARTR